MSRMHRMWMPAPSQARGKLRTEGNPFFAKEIVRELAERGVLQGQPKAYISTAEVADVSVPTTL
jgi:predicted ATPase